MINMSNNDEAVSDEAFAYTPGLKVKRATTVRKTRRLPLKGEVLVDKGTEVNYDTIVARTQMSGDPELIHVARFLNLEPDDIIRIMKVKIGDKVKEGDVIAGYSSLFGLIKNEVQSPMEGTIETISEVTGQVIVRAPPIPLEINAYIAGKVAEVLPEEGVEIEKNASFIQGIFGLGGETHGEIRIATDSNEEVLSVDKISETDKGKVLVGGSFVTYESLTKAMEVGVSCIIVGGVRHEDVVKLLGEEIGVAITGEEDVGLTLIITEGFGQMNMSENTFNLLRSCEGYLASANGATQIRAGVLRPEIIIPHDDYFEQAGREELSAGMVIGTQVRIIRQPYFGEIGTVSNLPVELQQVESQSYVRVLEVKLEDGSIATVPRANVEIIEE
jgi:hypothetical protein